MDENRKLGIFEGVFTPTVLTILGVIMYLRLGWVVGNAGFLGTLLIIGIAHIITFATVLSMSSIITNMDIGDGGAYTIVTRSLGLEMGGAIGIPLYLSQALSSAFYIIGFAEAWQPYFPNHNFKLVCVITWLVLFTIASISAKFAFKIQYIILVLVALSIGSFLFGNSVNSGAPVMVGNFEQASFWSTFAIFFPAVTGILAGVTMSGELKNPRSSIIKGTLTAMIVGLGVYVLLAFWFARQAPMNELLNNPEIILEVSAVRILVTFGILGAVVSSALSTLVGAPRTLAALAQNNSVPFSNFLSKKDKAGEPRIAIFFSSFLTLFVILFMNLNSLAEILTLFFLMTYGMLNIVVFVEKGIGITSFRPSMTLSIIVPIVGMVGCLVSMLLINPLFTVIAFIVIMLIYTVLSKQNLTSPWGDVRTGIFDTLIERLVQKRMQLEYHPKVWKPSILLPVENDSDFSKVSGIIKDLIYPKGRLYYLTVAKNDANHEESRVKINESLKPLKKKNLFANEIYIKGNDFNTDLPIVLQSLLNMFLQPNIIFFTLSSDINKRKMLTSNLKQIKENDIGIICMEYDKERKFGKKQKINLWLRDKSQNTNLAVLIALQLKKNWNAELNIVAVVKNDVERELMTQYHYDFIQEARLPQDTKVNVYVGDFREIASKETADITILGTPQDISVEYFNRMGHLIPGSIMFLADSGLENIYV